MFFRVTSAAALSVLVSGAHAADMPPYDPMPPIPASAQMPANWTGFYLGFGVGGGLSSDDYRFDTLDGRLGFDDTGNGGWLVDATLGYDYRLNCFLLGILGDVSWSDFGSDARVSAGDLGIGGTEASAYLDSQWGYDVLVRTGVLLNEHALLYALGGYSWRDFDAGYEYAEYDGLTLTTDSGSSGGDAHGWTVGGGIEAMVTSSISLKGEYRYTSFDELEMAMPDGTEVQVDPSEHSARVGINYRFGSLF